MFLQPSPSFSSGHCQGKSSSGELSRGEKEMHANSNGGCGEAEASSTLSSKFAIKLTGWWAPAEDTLCSSQDSGAFCEACQGPGASEKASAWVGAFWAWGGAR